MLTTHNNNTGLLQVFDGVSNWGSVGGNKWGYNQADVACRQLGYARAESAWSQPPTDDIFREAFISSVNCGDYEQSRSYASLNQCTFQGWDQDHQTVSSVAWVKCSGGTLAI